MADNGDDDAHSRAFQPSTDHLPVHVNISRPLSPSNSIRSAYLSTYLSTRSELLFYRLLHVVFSVIYFIFFAVFLATSSPRVKATTSTICTIVGTFAFSWAVICALQTSYSRRTRRVLLDSGLLRDRNWQVDDVWVNIGFVVTSLAFLTYSIVESCMKGWNGQIL